jgi:hypothetical protein
MGLSNYRGRYIGSHPKGRGCGEYIELYVVEQAGLAYLAGKIGPTDPTRGLWRPTAFPTNRADLPSKEYSRLPVSPFAGGFGSPSSLPRSYVRAAVAFRLISSLHQALTKYSSHC